MNGLKEFWEQQAKWSQDTFGLDSVRGPSGALKHLRKEVEEAIEQPDDIYEFADMLFLVFDSTRRAGFGYLDLLAACWTKLEINRKRKWGKPTSDEPVEHIRD